MFIKSLTIKNFRSFDASGIKVDFNDDLTAFIGRNGSGKTSILEALNMLIGQDYLASKVSEKDFHCDAIGIKDEIYIEGETVDPFFVNTEVISIQKPSSYTVSVPCNKIVLTIKRRQKAEKILDDPFVINKVCIPIEGEIQLSLYDKIGKSSKYKIDLLEKTEGQAIDLEDAKSIINDLLTGVVFDVEKAASISGYFYNIKFQLKSSKEFRSASFPAYALTFNPSRLKNVPKSYYLSKGRGDDISGGYSFISKILTDLHWRWRHKSSKLPQEQNNAGEKYGDMAHELRSIVDEKGALIQFINKKIKEICSEQKDLQFDFIDLDQPYKSAFISKIENRKFLLPENLGSGYNILIAYALFSYIVELEKVPIVLVIDEPELHLHSDWQRKMYDIFSAEKNLQIVYSTQSENFISLKNWQEIRSLSKSVIYPKQEVLDEIVVATDSQSGKRSEYLNDYAKNNLHISSILRENLELFFANKCILVEGPAEKYSLPRLLALSGCNISDYSVAIIPTWGKTKIKSYQMICKVFGVDYFTIFDEDDENGDSMDQNNGNENNAIGSNSISEQVVKFSSSFEKLLGVGGKGKFQQVVRVVDGLDNKVSLNAEIDDAINKIKQYIQS